MASEGGVAQLSFECYSKVVKTVGAAHTARDNVAKLKYDENSDAKTLQGAAGGMKGIIHELRANSWTVVPCLR